MFLVSEARRKKSQAPQGAAVTAGGGSGKRSFFQETPFKGTVQ
jgi:hypothetical protein